MLLEENCKFVNQTLHYCNEFNFIVCHHITVIFMFKLHYFFSRSPQCFANVSRTTFNSAPETLNDSIELMHVKIELRRPKLLKLI